MSVFRGGVLDQEQCLYLGRRPPGVGQLVLRPGVNNLMSLLLIKDLEHSLHNHNPSLIIISSSWTSFYSFYSKPIWPMLALPSSNNRQNLSFLQPQELRQGVPISRTWRQTTCLRWVFLGEGNFLYDFCAYLWCVFWRRFLFLKFLMCLFGRRWNCGMILTFDNFTMMNKCSSLLIFTLNNPSQGGNPRAQEESRRSAKSRGKSQNQLIAEFSITDKTIVNIFMKHCQRHNGPEGWVLLTKVTSLGHITSSQTNLD